MSRSKEYLLFVTYLLYWIVNTKSYKSTLCTWPIVSPSLFFEILNYFLVSINWQNSGHEFAKYTYNEFPKYSEAVKLQIMRIFVHFAKGTTDYDNVWLKACQSVQTLFSDWTTMITWHVFLVSIDLMGQNMNGQLWEVSILD